jgi:hypothetical protein
MCPGHMYHKAAAPELQRANVGEQQQACAAQAAAGLRCARMRCITGQAHEAD